MRFFESESNPVHRVCYSAMLVSQRRLFLCISNKHCVQYNAGFTILSLRPWHSQLPPFSFRCCCLMVLDCSAAMDEDEGKMSGRIMFIRTWATKFVRPNIVKTLESAPSTVGGMVVQWTCDHRGCGFKSRLGHGCLTTRGKLRPITKQ